MTPILRAIFNDKHIEDKFFVFTNPLYWVYMLFLFIVLPLEVFVWGEIREWWFILVKVRHMPRENLANFEGKLSRIKYKTRYGHFKIRVFTKMAVKRLSTLNQQQ